MHAPLGVDAPSSYFCHIFHAVYGLKQAPHVWYERFVFAIQATSFSPSDHDPALFIHLSSHGHTLLLL